MMEEKNYGFCATPPQIEKVKGWLSVNVCQALLFLIRQPELSPLRLLGFNYA